MANCRLVVNHWPRHGGVKGAEGSAAALGHRQKTEALPTTGTSVPADQLFAMYCVEERAEGDVAYEKRL